MEKHWSNYCSMSIVHFMAFPETAGGDGQIAASVAKIAEDDFFDAIEVAWINDRQEREKVSRLLQIGQLKVGFCAHPAILSQKLNLNSLDTDARRRAVEEMLALLDQAAELGAGSFVFLSGPDPGADHRDAALDALVESVREMCEYGSARGIRLTLETFDRSVDKKALVGPVGDAVRLAQAVRADYPDFGLLYDLSHMPLLEETPSSMALIKDHLSHVHVGNCVLARQSDLYGDLHPYLGVPGGVSGVSEVARFIRGLFDIGYLELGRDPKPWVGFEVKPQGPGETSELIIGNAKRIWRQAWFAA